MTDKVGVCISSYDEGTLLEGALSSAIAVGGIVHLLEGPVAGTGRPRPLPAHLADGVLGYREVGPKLHEPYTLVDVPAVRTYKDDADKRNVGLRWARRACLDWLVWLDGDEVLLWPEYLRDWIGRASQEETAVGGFPLRIVELDGSVALGYNRIVRVSVVRKYLVAASQVELHTGLTVGTPNVKVCGAGGIPWGNVPKFEGTDNYATPGSDEMEAWLARHRPPLHGEPHILHRSMLRNPKRTAQRQHEAEAERFAT